MNRNIKIIVSYDGTDFAGWQIQRNERTVQGVLERALRNLHGCRVRVTGAGRTDAGVHAAGQVANFCSTISSIPARKFLQAVNSHLPQDVRVLQSAEVETDFHARHCATGRVYRYRILTGVSAQACFSRYCWLVSHLPPTGVLNDMAHVFCGEHDFTSFAATGDSSSSFSRKIDYACFVEEGPEIVFYIKGNAFLWRMVRSILGSIVEIALKGGGPEDLRAILDSRDRRRAGATAPARGLFLHRVEYGIQKE